MTNQENKFRIGRLCTEFSKTIGVTKPTILTDGGSTPTSPTYEDTRQVKNTKFDFRPAAIFLVETTDQVTEIVKFVNLNNLNSETKIELRARSGGHDHEGECSGTDTWVIDFRNMKAVTKTGAMNDGDWRVEIQPGATFRDVSAVLGTGLAIPHGTCQSVAVAGYTMGGGWGPWTRKYGMACERLIGATIVLGNGDRLKITSRDPRGKREGDLMWALRGGGGFSYGIVTELVFRAFEVPKETYTAEVTFNVRRDGVIYRSVSEIVEQWVAFVRNAQEKSLLGTNLMIVASDQCADQHAALECTFKGYFEGKRPDIEALILRKFRLKDPNDIKIAQVTSNNQSEIFHKWEFPERINLESDPDRPHRITSRLATQGWNDESNKALICALQSKSLIAPRGEGVDQYVTLGAITGPFYDDYFSGSPLDEIAFPYRNRLFTVQFQAWWKHEPGSRKWANRAEDWIDECRHAKIQGTDGSFISFKDSAVPTKEYFSQNYEALKTVKTNHSEDTNLLFRTRKTII
jgi:hypothetical protein